MYNTNCWFIALCFVKPIDVNLVFHHGQYEKHVFFLSMEIKGTLRQWCAT